MRVYLHTFGCRANEADSEALRALLTAEEHELVSSPGEADAAVFNSCAVTADAEADLRQHVRRAARANPALRTTIMGCAAALDRGALRALPTVHRVVGGGEPAEVAAALGVTPALGGARRTPQSGARAVLRIQDGCDEHCTFCATTLARGASRSRSPDRLVEESAQLAEWHPEIVLTGVHIGAYGADIGSSLAALLERLVREVPRVRFRLTSVEATEVDERLRELLVGEPGRVAPSLHAPLQSGSARVLRRMGRRWYTPASYAAAVEALVSRAAVFGLGADVIAGFPGETAHDHAATLELVERLPFTYLHVFRYSARPGTAATRLGDRVPGDVVARRAAELRALGARTGEAYRSARSGSEADVVVTGGGPRREGVTEDFLTVTLTEPAPPRRARVRARLVYRDGVLFAHPRDV